ncbi:MAG: hypothetical protein N3A72_01175 [bacterium]|nr:hypothetical protein [bacterium]
MNVDQWIDKLIRFDQKTQEQFALMYGDSLELIQERRQAYLTLLTAFRDQFGVQSEVIVSRSPSRINLKGVHIEHRGGYVNYLTHYREILIAGSARSDDIVHIHNLRSALFPARTFSIHSEKQKGNWQNWLEYISAEEVVRAVTETQGDWSNYIKAAVLRVQSEFPNKPLTGMNLFVNGSIPFAAGLSSSSALVVAATLVTLGLNNERIDPTTLVELCGQAEWYVGTRGGAGDHAAMLLGKRNQIAHIQFYPLQVQYYPFPSGYEIVICNSFKPASKSKDVKDMFNSRIAGYELGFLLIKKNYPEFAAKLEHLRDINAHHLGVSESTIYRMLKSLPETMTRAEAYAQLSEHKEHLDELFCTHDEPATGYRVRDIILFGLAECERGKICVDFLANNDMVGFGKLMSISHDGDRVVEYDSEKNCRPYNNHTTVAQLEQLISDLESNEPERIERAQLYRQSGGYRCSCAELDLLVDIARRIPGVVGAGLTGAGLGGCVLVLVEKNQVDRVLNVLQQEYYTPRALPLGAERCISVSGAGLVCF